MTPRRRSRLGWLGPAIAVVGVLAAVAGAWFMVVSRPVPGAVIDTLRIDDTAYLVVRAEQEGNRNFVELHRRGAKGDVLVWRALVPPYAGRPAAPGIAWNDVTVSVRVLRNDRAEVFALAMRDAHKLGGFGLAPGKGPAKKQAVGPVTMTDHVRSYEIVAGADWHQLVAFELRTGEALWKQDLGAAPVEDGGVQGEIVWVRQDGKRREFRVRDGTEVPSA